MDICPDIQTALPAQYAVLTHVTARRRRAHDAVRTHTTAPRFLFIPDLTDKATGAVLIVLIMLYVGTQLASSLMMSTPTMDKTQRR